MIFFGSCLLIPYVLFFRRCAERHVDASHERPRLHELARTRHIPSTVLLQSGASRAEDFTRLARCQSTDFGAAAVTSSSGVAIPVALRDGSGVRASMAPAGRRSPQHLVHRRWARLAIKRCSSRYRQRPIARHRPITSFNRLRRKKTREFDNNDMN